MGYVGDVCVSRHVEECVFLEETRPEIHLRTLPMAKQPLEAGAGTPGGEKGGAAPTTSDGAGKRTVKS
jgi:hypothetical protein